MGIERGRGNGGRHKEESSKKVSRAREVKNEKMKGRMKEWKEREGERGKCLE